jgi:hypothetical protein
LHVPRVFEIRVGMAAVQQLIEESQQPAALGGI